MVWLYRNNFLCAALLAGLLFVYPAGAEVLSGTVVSVKQQSFVVREDSTPSGRELNVIFVPAQHKPHIFGQPYPYCVRIGRPIHLKGRLDADKKIFFAKEIRGCPGPGKHHDPTGVRARLGRCRNPRARHE
jgi:hypothetical protein